MFLGYLLIFTARVLDVTLATLRMLMVVQGRKLYSAFVGFFEIIIYITALNQVVSNLDNIGNLLAYALGFACGNYVGIMIEEKIALGTLEVQIIHKGKSSEEMVEELRNEGFGVTILTGQGREGSRDVIKAVIRRKDLMRIKKLVYKYDPNAFIITNSISSISGGYFRAIKKK
ncbi:MAG: DUF2179 domain-containing protein [Tissierellia bacterium]|nr:DUF2179 domain-containing protein [Tissierellia bacterium]